VWTDFRTCFLFPWVPFPNFSISRLYGSHFTQTFFDGMPIERARQGLFTIYTGKSVGLPFGSVWANGKQISVLGKFRSRLALTICRNHYHLPKSLHDGDGWREGRKTKALINKTTTLHVRYFWCISLTFCAQLQREMTKFNFLWGTQTHDGEFSFFIIIIM